MAQTERVVIVGGPRCGKSWAARDIYRESRGAVPWFCGDPLSTVKEPDQHCNYLPEGLGFGSDASRWIVDHWLPMPGPWVLEGHVMARVLRKWMRLKADIEMDREGLVLNPFPCDRVIVFLEQRPELDLKPGQVTLHRTVMKQWKEIEDYYEAITELR